MDNNVIAYVVFKENTLGYLFLLHGGIGLGVLADKPTKGGLNWKNGPYLVSPNDYKQIRKATLKDFDYFNVVSDGYFN